MRTTFPQFGHRRGPIEVTPGEARSRGLQPPGPRVHRRGRTAAGRPRFFLERQELLENRRTRSQRLGPICAERRAIDATDRGDYEAPAIAEPNLHLAPRGSVPSHFVCSTRGITCSLVLSGDPSYFGSGSDWVWFLQWTESGASLTGQFQEVYVTSDNPLKVQSENAPVTGIRSGSDVTLSVGGPFFGETWTGTLRGNTLTLTVPQRNGLLAAVALKNIHSIESDKQSSEYLSAWALKRRWALQEGRLGMWVISRTI